MQPSNHALSAILRDGSLGGDRKAVWDQLGEFQQIQASSGVFVATLYTGSVVTWDNSRDGSLAVLCSISCSMCCGSKLRVKH